MGCSIVPRCTLSCILLTIVLGAGAFLTILRLRHRSLRFNRSAGLLHSAIIRALVGCSPEQRLREAGSASLEMASLSRNQV